jgi:hypothetical protein
MKDNPLSPEDCVSLEHMAIQLAHNKIENEKELKSTKVNVNSSLGSLGF